MSPSPSSSAPGGATNANPTISALEEFIQQSKPSSPASKSPVHHPDELRTLALQVAHNLKFQHEWSEIRFHYRPSERATGACLPRPLLSGLPPRRLYVHPDEQIEVLRQQREQGKAGWPDLASEREWVLPTHLRESWTLRRFAEVFDALAVVPREGEGTGVDFPEGGAATVASHSTPAAAGSGEVSTWRKTQPKRLLLSTVEDDSTVVYYIVHDGIVKPRQN